jgi:glycosyltransferase involved in cell wall biosynthesis
MISGDRSALSGKQGAFWYTLEELRKHFDRIDVLCPRARIAGVPSFDIFENVFIHPATGGLLSHPSWIAQRGAELMQEHGHRVMTVQEYPPFYNGLGARRLHKSSGVPYVLEVHHVVGHPSASSVSEWIGRKLSPSFLRTHAHTAAAVRVVNAATQSLLVEFGIPREKITVVPSFYLDGDLAHITVGYPSCDLAFCGRFVPNKGLMRLLEAIADMPNVSLIVVGDGPQRAECEQFVRAKVMSNRVHFAGWLPTQMDVWHMMLHAKAFVMPSLSEGGPRVALEAMACGMAVIATRVGVMPDVIADGENGMLTDGSPEDLRRCIRHLLDDDGLRRRMGNEARRILERFERKKLIGEYAEFIQGHASVSGSSGLPVGRQGSP